MSLRKKRIALVSMYGFRELNGSNLRLFYLTRELIAQGVGVDFIVPSEEDASSVKERFNFCGSDKIKTHYSKFLKGANISSAGRFINYFFIRFMLGNILNGIKADLVYASHMPSGEAALHSGGEKIKVIDVFDVWSDYLEVSSSRLVKWGILPYLKWREKTVFRNIDKIITCTSQTGKFIEERYGIPSEKISIIHDGVDTDMFVPGPNVEGLREQLGIDAEDFVVTFHGGMKKHDGLRLLIEAVRVLKDEIPLKILLIGDGNQCDALKSYARLLTVERQVIFAGKVPHEKIPGYLAISDAGVISRLTWQGDIAASMMECMACSVPVISSSLEGIEDYFQDREEVLLFKMNDHHSLAEKIREMYSDKGLYEKIRMNSRKSIMRFDRKKSARKLFVYLNGLIEDRDENKGS